MNLGCAPNGPNGPGTEFGPSLVETDAGTLLYFSSGGALGSNTQDIYVSAQLADGSFGAPEPVAELNTSSDDVMPNVSKNGLEVVFASNRPGGEGAFDIYSSTRSSTSDPWSSPVNLEAVNTGAPETRPSLSWDGERLYLGRAGEIYVSHRAKQ
jgi:Tol biopolymer transport system component